MKRESPKQNRAKRSIEYIADAAIQVLDSDEIENFTTNHIAERAGVSVGTIYRYFKDKREVFRYMVRREVGKGLRDIRGVLNSSSAKTGTELSREVFAQTFDLFDQRPRAAFNIIHLIRRDPELRAEVDEWLNELNKEYYARLIEIEPDKFKPVSDEGLSSSLAAYYAATAAVTAMRSDRSLDLNTHVDLALNLFETFKHDGVPDDLEKTEVTEYSD